MLSGGSRSTTPTSRKSPAHDVATQSNQSRNDQSGNNSARRGSRNKSQPRERKDSAKNDQVEHKVIKEMSKVIQLTLTNVDRLFYRLHSDINNSMETIKETGAATIVAVIIIK